MFDDFDAVTAAVLDECFAEVCATLGTQHLDGTRQLVERAIAAALTGMAKAGQHSKDRLITYAESRAREVIRATWNR